MPFSVVRTKSLDARRLKGLADVIVSSEKITFSGGWTREKAADLLESIDVSKREIQQVEMKAFTPSESDYADVRKRLKNPDKFDLMKFGFYEVVVADTNVDFGREVISKEVLESLALQAIDGVSILVNHDRDTVIGHSYSGDVRKIAGDPTKWEFVSKFYVPNDSLMPNGQNAVSAIDSGIWKFISIGFRNDSVEFVQGTGSDDYYLVYKYDAASPPVLVEYSVVYRGMQPRAKVKTLESEKFKFTDENTFPMKRKIKFMLGYDDKGVRKSMTTEVEMPETDVEVPVPPVIQAEIDSLAEKAKETDSLKAELKAIKSTSVEAVKSLQTKLEQSVDADDYLYSLSSEDISKKLDSLKAIDAKLNPKNQIAGRTEKGGNAEPSGDGYNF